MNKIPSRLLFLVTTGFALAACTLKKPKTTAASPNYQAPVSMVAAPANIKAVCYSDADLSTYRVRMVQQELAVGVLSCKDAAGNRRLTEKYQAFVNKFGSDLSTNAAEIKAMAGRKRLNLDVVVTEIANRTAQQPSVDPTFCSRHERAFDWSLTSQVTSLTQVPAPYDFGPEMKVFACPRA